MRGKMKGGIEHPVVAVFLVILGVLVISLTIGFYLRSAVTGEPIQVKTYAEYRWMNYFPSSVLFYLSPGAWDAINEVVQLPCDEVKLRKRTEFYNVFSSRLSVDYKEGFNKFNELMENLEKHTKKEKHSYIIKDKKGLVISLGLPGNMINVSRATVFPEEYPYNCFYKDMPILSKETDNTRVKFIFCCGDIIHCDDYLAGAGRNECVEDPCGIGPCKLDLCGNMELIRQLSAEEYRKTCLDKKEGTRVCVSDRNNDNGGETEGLCSDGVDNDHDGFTDAFDSDCYCHTDACSCPTSEGNYTTWICNGNKVYVDCNANKCWTPTQGAENWTTGSFPSYNCQGSSCIGGGSDCPACNYCDTLNYGGFTDWVLPDITTLKNLCNSSSCSGACFDEEIFTGIYWSSTENNSDNAYKVSFDFCFPNYKLKNTDYHVRCVRRGACTEDETGLCSDGKDNDCDGFTDCDDIDDCVDVDNDGDEHSPIDACPGGLKPRDDCDDDCATCYPGSTEYTCAADGKDQNCDGEIDEWDFGEWSLVSTNCGNSEESCKTWLDRIGAFSSGCSVFQAVKCIDNSDGECNYDRGFGEGVGSCAFENEGPTAYAGEFFENSLGIFRPVKCAHWYGEGCGDCSGAAYTYTRFAVIR